MTELNETSTAKDILFADSAENIGATFNLHHNLSAYNELVAEKYADSIASLRSPQFESYMVAGRTGFSNKSELEQYAPAQKYAPFRPKIFDTNLEEIDFSKPGLPNAVQSGSPQLIAETEVCPAPVCAEKETYDATEDTAFTPVLKLNGKGIIWVVAFITVAVLVIAFIIANSVAISGANVRISSLQAQNSAYYKTLSDLRVETSNIYSQAVAATEHEVMNNPEYTYIGTASEKLNLPKWQPQKNQDRSTNWFDRLSGFLSGLFG